MLEFHNVKVSGLEESVIASRYAMMTELPDLKDDDVKKDCFDRGLSRSMKLSVKGGGSGHTSFRKGIRVSFDMIYTQYITKQFQRYHFFDYISSSSLMHKISKMDFSKCCNKYVTDNTIDEIEYWKFVYNKIVEEHLEKYIFKTNKGYIVCDKYEDCVYTAYMMMISNCPMGTELFVHVNTNYEQLATIYRQRKHHKLKEDYQAFKDMVENLPYAKELIMGDYGKNNEETEG